MVARRPDRPRADTLAPPVVLPQRRTARLSVVECLFDQRHVYPGRRSPAGASAPSPYDVKCPSGHEQYLIWGQTVSDIEVHGTVAPGFEPVRDEFAAVLAEQPDEPGAQLAAYHDGALVVDLWAGDGVAGDSLTGVFSSGKGAAYLVVALLVQEGVLDLDRAVAYYWPEFAAEGKADVTLRELLAHRAGVVGVDGGFGPGELADDHLIAARLAAQRPFWRPGSAYGYHCFGIGAI